MVYYRIGGRFMSSVTWSFVTPLKDNNKIEAVKSLLSISFPEELVHLIEANNGGSPSLTRCNIPGFGETDFKMLLSYNNCDEESVFDVLDFFIKKYHKRVLPFASDSGSGYYCIKDDYVVYASEETDSLYPLAEDINSFFDLLY